MLKVIKNIDHRTGMTYSEKRQYIEDSLNEEGYRVPPHKAGAKMFDDIPLPAEMTFAEKGRMGDLARYMISDTNMLGYRASGKILPYTLDHLIGIIDLSQKRGRQFIKKMIRLGVMQIVTRKYNDMEIVEYYVNPAYFFAGRRISFNLYLLFREHLDLILPKWVKAEFLSAANEFEGPPLPSQHLADLSRERAGKIV